MIKKIYRKIRKSIDPSFFLRENDVVLVGFPKSGNTWLRFIFANIISLKELGGKVVDYNLLNNELRGALDSYTRPSISYKSLPVILVTHKYYRKEIFSKNKCIFLYRDPGDTMVSYFEYRKNLKDNSKYKGNFQSFIRDSRFGIEAWCKHFISWENKAVVNISYEELKFSAKTVIINIINSLNISQIEGSIIETAIERSSFRKIKSMEETKGKDKEANNHLEKNFRFARKGEVGEWKKYFDENDILYFNEVLSRFNLDKFAREDSNTDSL